MYACLERCQSEAGMEHQKIRQIELFGVERCQFETGMEHQKDTSNRAGMQHQKDTSNRAFWGRKLPI